MKIKNIRRYRTFYKENVRHISDLSRDEHFIGNYTRNGETNEKQFGWFDIYHGDKEGHGEAEEGIKNFLQSFLDMAKDGQAVYEFLQNAVDAGSSHFTMAWGLDPVDGNHYVLVANNGEMFNQKSIRSILNVGSSTKTADSQNIGKFGIGFKLAHRLVGKENGLDELLSEDPSGPILFSWKNHELEELASANEPIPEELEFEVLGNDDYTFKDLNPWLFKILITCFPVLPENNLVEENVQLTRDNIMINDAFKRSEYEALCRWVKNYKDILDKDLYKEGSLFFIRLGSGKEHDLADKNLAQGVKFSLAILQETAEKGLKSQKGLQTVQLNRQVPIEKPDLNYLLFKITKEENLEKYLFVRFGVTTLEELDREQLNKFNKETDIEVLFGFRHFKETGDYFKGAPNFYLYFPLSEEVHNFNFVLHSNAFYKASSRTFLHKGTEGDDGINERLLRTIAQSLEEQLKLLYHSDNEEDKTKFLNLYAALLTSTESGNNERQWIKAPFIKELTKILKRIIPVRLDSNSEEYQISDLPPVIKKTGVELPPEAYGHARVKWFYWGVNAPKTIIYQAVEKLSLKVFDIFKLLRIKNIYSYINEWIEEDYSRVNLLLEELRVKDVDVVKSEHFKENIKKIKLFRFPDGSFLSDEELVSKQEEGYIVLHKNLKNIQPELLKIGIQTSTIDLDDLDIYSNYNPYFSSTSQLRNYNKVIEIISEADVEKLTTEEKWKVFKIIRDGTEEGRRKERLGELKLFQNNLGQCVYLKNLLGPSKQSWLRPFQIKNEESNSDINRYLVTDKNFFYERIVFPFWTTICGDLIKRDPAAQNQIFIDIQKWYNLSEDSKENENQLYKNKIIFFQGEPREAKRLFYHPDLVKISKEDYHSVQQSVFKFLNVQVPDREYINLYNEAPFELEPNSEGYPTEELSVSSEEAQKLFLFWDSCNVKILEHFTVKTTSNDTFSLCKIEGKNYWSNSDRLRSYVLKYHSEALLPLPNLFSDFIDLVPIKDTTLYCFLEDNLDPNDEHQFIDLLNASLQESDEVLIKFFQLGRNLKLDTSNFDEERNVILLKVLKRLLQADQSILEKIHERIYLIIGDQEVAMNSIDSANDRVEINFRNKQIYLSRSHILNLEDDRILAGIQDFANETIAKNFLTETEARLIFKLRKEDLSEELVLQFLENSGKKIANTDQLLMVLATREEHKDLYKGLKILNKLGSWESFTGNLVLPNPPFGTYEPRFILSDAFEDLPKRLHLGKDGCLSYGDPGEEEVEENLILPFFQFRRGVTTDIFQVPTDKLQFLKDLYQIWLQTPNEIKASRASEEWEPYVNFNPQEKLIGEWVYAEEKLEDEITLWINREDESRIRFLSDIGIHTSSSHVAILRAWLMSDGDTSCPVGVEQIPEIFLNNTLLGLAEGFSGNNATFTTEINSKQHEIIVRIIVCLWENSEESFDFRVPVYTRSGKLRMGSEQHQFPKYLSEIKYETLINSGFDLLSNLPSCIEIIFPDSRYKDLISSLYYEQEIALEFQVPEIINEHDEPFYKSWSEEHNNKLFRVPSLNYLAKAITQEEEYLLGTVIFNNYEINQVDDHWHIYYNNNITLENLVVELQKDEQDVFAIEVEELIAERDEMLKAFYHALTSSGREDFDDEDLKRLNDNLKERNSEEKRKEIVENLAVLSRYSYQWFLGYIEYLLSFEQLADNITQKSISFQKVEPCIVDGKPSKRYFLLRGATSMIPINIESFEDFDIRFIFNGGRKENLNVEGVSKKGQDLQVYVPQGINSELIDNFSKVLNIKITFRPVLDLIQKLYTSFKNEDVISPWSDIKEELQPMHFIYGPPGTGKTTKICRSLEEAYVENPFFRALILVPTNKAGDVIAKKLLSDRSELSIVRIGNPTDPELDHLDPGIYQPSLDEDTWDVKNVVITTVHRLPYYQIARDHGAHYKLYSSHKKWDLVIFDEASMTSLPYIVFALMSLKRTNPSAEYIVAGDPKQIPPVIDTTDKNIENLEMDDENIYKMMGIHSFRENEQQLIKREVDVIENLTSQYRSVEAIGKFFSGLSYNDLLSHKRDMLQKPKKELPDSFINELKAPISLINLPIDSSNSVMEPRKLLYSSYQMYAGILTTELVKYLDRCNKENTEYTIGIVSPYKAQAMLINKLVTSSGVSANINVYCDTVHGFQGDECDIIIFVVNPNNNSFTGHKKSLLNKEYIYNVAVSRAKDHLWILNPFEDITNNPFINSMREILGPEVGVLNNQKLENYLFKDPNFIIRNSHLTGHDSINVFGQMEMKYFIKAGNTAIDIQIIDNTNVSMDDTLFISDTVK